MPPPRGRDRRDREPQGPEFTMEQIQQATQGQKKYSKFRKDNRCRFCRNKIALADYKEIDTLAKLCTNQGKIYSRRRSGNCAFHQRSATEAIKRARYMALIPYAGSLAI